jgi:hypothetical protein
MILTDKRRVERTYSIKKLMYSVSMGKNIERGNQTDRPADLMPHIFELPYDCWYSSLLSFKCRLLGWLYS